MDSVYLRETPCSSKFFRNTKGKGKKTSSTIRDMPCDDYRCRESNYKLGNETSREIAEYQLNTLNEFEIFQTDAKKSEKNCPRVVGES